MGKRILRVVLLLSAVALLAGCATPYPQGALLTQIGPQKTPNTGGGLKVGIAKCQSVLGLLATGDCSETAAMKNGGITKINHVDWSANNILGIYGQYELRVYGR